MTGATIHVTLQDTGIRRALAAAHASGRDMAPLMRAIGAGLADNTRDRFNAEQDPAGNAWKPLRDFYAPLKKGPGILRESGMRDGLQGSITFEANADEVSVGSNKIYAGVHQFGAVIRPVRAKALVFPTAFGLVRARQVTIPARPYLGISAADEETILDAAEVMLDRWMRAGAGTPR